MPLQTSDEWRVTSGELKPRLELRRDPKYGWEWWGRFALCDCYDFIRIGSARYLTLADALRVYGSGF